MFCLQWAIFVTKRVKLLNISCYDILWSPARNNYILWLSLWQCYIQNMQALLSPLTCPLLWRQDNDTIYPFPHTTQWNSSLFFTPPHTTYKYWSLTWQPLPLWPRLWPFLFAIQLTFLEWNLTQGKNCQTIYWIYMAWWLLFVYSLNYRLNWL